MSIYLCDYGCGKEGKFQLKNGKWCCGKTFFGCENYRRKMSKKMKGVIPWNKGKNKNNSHGVFKQSIKMIEMRKDPNSVYNSKDYKNNHLKSMNSSHTRKKISILSLGRTSPNKGKLLPDSQKILIRNTLKMSIEEIKKKYPFFSKIEEMRYNSDKPIEEKEIQVHCKNHTCENSKEKGGWFTPSRSQFQGRKNWLENKGRDICYFYCSEECKQICPLYNLRSDPFKEIDYPYTQEEYQVWRKAVLEQDKYECQMCGSKENLHCHHIIPVKLDPIFALDPDNGICLCQDCHYEYGHKTGTECSTGNLSNKICENKRKEII